MLVYLIEELKFTAADEDERKAPSIPIPIPTIPPSAPQRHSALEA